MSIKVSFVVPIYNVESYVERCIRSITDQSLTDIEIICINDASTDASIDIVKRLASKDPRIKIYHNKRNRGLSFSRNKGLTKANGEYVWFVDSDDWIIDRNAAEMLYRKAKESDIQVLTFDCENAYENEKLHDSLEAYIRKNAPSAYEELDGVKMFASQMITGSFMCTAWLYFFNRSWLDNSHIRFVEGILHEDLLFSAMVMLSADNIGYIPQKFYSYFRREGSIMVSADYIGRRVASYAYIIMELLAWTRKKEFNNDIIDAISYYIRIIKQAMVEQYLMSVLEDSTIPFFRQSDRLALILAVEDAFPFIKDKITHDLCSKLKHSDLIIVYGAGVVSEITRRFLHGIGIRDYSVAVTKGKTGSIHELSEFKDKSAILLISVTREKQQEMIDYARSLGLYDYVCMV